MQFVTEPFFSAKLNLPAQELLILKDLSGLFYPRTMGFLWGSTVLLCTVALLRVEGSEAQQTKNNVPRLKLSYKGECVSCAVLP